MIFGPFVFFYVVLLFVFLVFVFVAIEIHLINYAFTLAGLPPQLAFAALLGSLFGSYVNIPVARLRGIEPHPVAMITSYGVRYRVPRRRWDDSTMLAVNVGGALVPVLVSVYLLAHQPEALLQAMLATAIVALVVNRSARPIRGLGIATPMFIPPIVAALAGYILGGAAHAAPVAYVGGVLGTLIGADIMNIGRLRDLGAPVASIGGAGTFDGIFLTGLIAVLLA
ncbi:MAG TPA: DUF1614 domain-containing protein [Candidatus Binataceae bacterium]|nr:DUF1614 domain-containing protein [Candidatus Binataceae bacterium]